VLGKTFEEFFEKVVSEACEGPLRFEQLSDPAGYLIDVVEKYFYANLDWRISMDEQPAPPVPNSRFWKARPFEGFFREIHEMEEEPSDLLYLHVALGFSKDEVSRILELPMGAVESRVENAIQ
jgi:DNA-directed RNA polymerase specialized sigma24 family protein